jgi:hypothetical protein
MPTVAIDFDGVISKYKSYEGKGVFGEPTPCCVEAIKALKDRGWIVIIHTTRSETHQIKEYLDKHMVAYDYINYNPENIDRGCNMGKPLADIYIDDRAVRFNGDWMHTIEEVLNFKPYWKI